MQESRCTVTENRNFKMLVRARMAQTGLNYTATRALVLKENTERAVAAEREHRKVLTRFIQDGALVSFPFKRKARAHVLLYLVNLFDPGTTYTEQEVNDILRPVWSDVAYLRRELVNYGYLERNSNSGIYRLSDLTPQRAKTVFEPEAPEWERVWLASYLSGNAERFILNS